MPTTDSGFYREAIRRKLAKCTGEAPNAGAIAEATLSTWHQVAARLSPVIGERGTDALLSRSVHLTGNAYPWLAMAGDQADQESRLAAIKTRLAGCETDTATEASYTLFTTFVELLAALIGASLTERLLGPVWAPPLTTSEKEIPSWTTK